MGVLMMPRVLVSMRVAQTVPRQRNGTLDSGIS